MGKHGVGGSREMRARAGRRVLVAAALAALSAPVAAQGTRAAAALSAGPGLSAPTARAAPAAQGGPGAGGQPLECAKCHSLPNLGYRENPAGPARSFTVAPGALRASAHGKLSCVQCHPDITAYPHVASAARKRVSCDQDCHAVDGAGRPYTHAKQAAELRESVHGAKSAGAGDAGAAPGATPVTSGAGAATASPDPDHPVCLSCHGQRERAAFAAATGPGGSSLLPGDPHAIAPVSRMTARSKLALCVACHDDRRLMERKGVPAEAVASYRRSFHYKAIRFGDERTAVCSDCHSAHHVLRPGDARSTVAAVNLPKTCGQANCHAGAGRNFAVSGANHLDLRIAGAPILWFEEKFFLVLTGGTMLMLLVGIVLDVQRKFGWLALGLRLAGAVRRRATTCRPTFVRRLRRGARLARQLLVD